MADTQQPDTDPSSAAAWSDADYIPSLRRLEAIQNQINTLRAALPSILGPLTARSNDSPALTPQPSKVYADFAAHAMQAMSDVKALREQWQHEETKRILQHAEECLDKEADVEWEFVQKSRFDELPLGETNQDVEMTTEDMSNAVNEEGKKSTVSSV